MKSKEVIMLGFLPLCKREFNTLETIQLLKMNTDMFLSSWCVTGLLNYNNKGLLLTVCGRYHKGYVFISLDFNDTYTVDIINFEGNILDTYEMIYFDMLTKTIDDRIETVRKICV
jgi:hypothetical protein